jgi:hypothetical protein
VSHRPTITDDEMREWFGDMIPAEVVAMVFNAPPSKTLGELRREIRAFAMDRMGQRGQMSDSIEQVAFENVVLYARMLNRVIASARFLDVSIGLTIAHVPSQFGPSTQMVGGVRAEHSERVRAFSDEDMRQPVKMGFAEVTLELPPDRPRGEK